MVPRTFTRFDSLCEGILRKISGRRVSYVYSVRYDLPYVAGVRHHVEPPP